MTIRSLKKLEGWTRFFLANVPEDGLPPWDFRAPWDENMAMT
jgi:unsaturated chondroitin disaccharide hydrolase